MNGSKISKARARFEKKNGKIGTSYNNTELKTIALRRHTCVVHVVGEKSPLDFPILDRNSRLN